MLNDMTSTPDKVEIKPEDKVHFLKIAKMPKFANLGKTGDEWNVVGGMVMNEDAEEDFVGLAVYSLEGSFKELDDANIATKLVMDGVE